MGGGGGGGGTQVIPFNMSELAPFMPSVFNGPYNAEGANQNEQMLASKYPWITPPAGQFAGAQPGQFANGASSGSAPGFFGGLPFFGGNGVPPAPNPNPPIAPSAPGAPGTAQFNPAGTAVSAPNGMGQTPLSSILSVLMAGQPAAAPAGGQ